MALLKDTIISGICRVVGDFFANGFASAAGFKKSGSSDSYVLLGGGGHKAESSLSVNYAASAGSAPTLSSTRSPSSSTTTVALVKNSWTQALDLSSLQGSVLIQIADWTNSGGSGAVNYYTAVVMINGSTGRLDEIALHSAMATSSDTAIPRRLFAAMEAGKLKLSSMDDSSTNHYLVFRYCKLISI